MPHRRGIKPSAQNYVQGASAYGDRTALCTATLLVAGTCAFLRIFPLSTLLRTLETGRLDAPCLYMILPTMAAGIIAGGFTCGCIWRHAHARILMAVSIAICAFPLPVFALTPEDVPLHWAIAAISGIGLGFLAVSLSALLPSLHDPRRILMACGMGTALGYTCCNIPLIANSTPAFQAIVAMLILVACGLSLFCWNPKRPSCQANQGRHGIKREKFIHGTIFFLFLASLDLACMTNLQGGGTANALQPRNYTDILADVVVFIAVAHATGLKATLHGTRYWLACALAMLAAAVFMLDADAPVASWAHLPYAAGTAIYSTFIIAWLPLSGGFRIPRNTAILQSVIGSAGTLTILMLAHAPAHIPSASILAAMALVATGALLVARMERMLKASVGFPSETQACASPDNE